MMDNPQLNLLNYKPLKEDSDYLIYNDGRLFSKKTNRFLKGKIDNVGYLTYALAIGDRRSSNNKKLSKMLYAHRLVAEYFIDNPNNFPIVHHKDENKLNNNWSNLEWVTEKENTQYSLKNRGERKKPKYIEKNLDGEEWKVIPDIPNYSVSSMGRVKNNKTNRLLHLDEAQKYVRIMLSCNDSSRRHFYVHRLVYCTFTGDYDLENYVIDHIDNNPKNNSLSNLQKITFSENSQRQERNLKEKFNDYPS